MPPAKVLIFVACLGFIVFVGFLLRDPHATHDLSECNPDELHSHDGGALHCDA